MKLKKVTNWERVPEPENYFTLIEDLVYNEIFQTNVYSVLEGDMANKNVLDIGGHFGIFSLFANCFNAKQIIGIEANPANFARYLHNTKEIRNLKAINAACTDRSGDVITISNDGMGSRINTGNIAVSTISLVDALNLFPEKEDVFVKIDIEGAEHLILKNIDPVFLLRKVSGVTMEIHDEIISGTGNSIENLKNYMTAIGYSITWQGWYTHSKDTCIVKFAR